jgi:flagellar basal body rod protein FlgC
VEAILRQIAKAAMAPHRQGLSLGAVVPMGDARPIDREHPMDSILGIARSGLQISSLRLASSAHDVANALTHRFVPSRVEAEAVEGGGVTGRVIRDEPPVEAQVDRLTVALSGTDLAREMVNQSLAATSFLANLATLRTADEATRSLLDVET